MKKIKSIIFTIMVLSVSLTYLACNRDIPQVAPIQTGMGTSASVQVISAAIKASRNYIYVDGTPVSGAALAYGGVFPGTAYSFWVNAGIRNFQIRDTLKTSTQVPLTFPGVMDPGKSYTIFTYDTITNIQQLTVTNNIVVSTDTTCRLRFANFIYNTTAVAGVDVYSYRKGTTIPIFTNVATTQVTDFVPYPSGLTDTLYVYATGTTTPLLVKSLVPSLVPNRSYTSLYSGSYKTTGTGITAKSITTFVTY